MYDGLGNLVHLVNPCNSSHAAEALI